MLRKAGLLALVVALILLVSGAAQAMPLAGSAWPAESAGVIERLCDWVAGFFPRLGQVSPGETSSSWEADGSHMDPNGID